MRTPGDWIEAAYGARPALRYACADGDDPVALLETVDDLAGWVRSTRRPAFLHLRTVRYLGHAGTGGSQTANDTATLNITAQNDTPTATITLAAISRCVK